MQLFFWSFLTGGSVNQDALVGPQVAEVEQHHVGGDVVDGEGGRLLEAHALWDEEGVARRRHHHLLPQPKAAQHHHLVADLPGGEDRRSVNTGEEQNCIGDTVELLFVVWFSPTATVFLETLGPPGNTRSPPRPAETRTVCSRGAASKHRERWSDAAALVTVATSSRERTKDHRNDPAAPFSSIFTSETLNHQNPRRLILNSERKKKKKS